MRRLDHELATRRLAASRTKAAALVLSGHVTVDGTVTTKPSTRVSDHTRLCVTTPDRYVSRAAHKLNGALDAFDLDPGGRILDAGASTGGFSQVLLEHGADRVYAVDVGHDQLHPAVRDDPRVVVRERLNLRDLELNDLDGNTVDWVVADVSFISLTLLLDPLLSVLGPAGQAVLMVKPQFEVGRAALGPRGVVRSEADRDRAIDGVIAAAAPLGWRCASRNPSPLPGEYGNREEFVHLVRREQPRPPSHGRRCVAGSILIP